MTISKFSTKCWNCGKNNYQETYSREYCPDCKVECNYHGNGANKLYWDAMERKHAREKQQEEEEFREYMKNFQWQE